MPPRAVVVGLATLLSVLAWVSGHAASSFDLRLARDKQPVHVLNRLAYGPTAGDLDDVRRLGVDKWIAQQLAPERVPENPVLAVKLRDAVSVSLPTWQLFEKFPQIGNPAPPPPLNQLVTAAQVTKLQTGSLDERRAVIDGLAADTRVQVLARLAPGLLDGLPELQVEAATARDADQKARQQTQRDFQKKARPPLNELLSDEQQRTWQKGTEQAKLALLESLDADARTLVLRVVPAQSVPVSFRRQALQARDPQRVPQTELTEARLYRAVYSKHQLEEVLVDFWLNHFNVFSGKGPVNILLTSYERDAIRPHVLGRFHDLLLATARHPAMLYYLDNFQSQARQDPPGPNPNLQVRRPGLNENYGRELLELHTLGVDGGYTQADVIAVARAFTGWTIFDPNRIGEFQFNPAMHDRGEKVVLGHTIARGGAEGDGLAVLDILATHPSTARFISRSLAQRFVADDPPQSLVTRMADTFARTDGDLRAVMQTMLTSHEFMSEGAWRSKTKSPLEMVVSALRALDADVTDTTAVAQRIADLGQPFYGKLEPNGYPNAGDSWTNSAGILGRINFANAVTAGQIGGVKVNVARDTAPDRMAMRVFGVSPPAELLATLQKRNAATPVPPAELATVLIASPDFQKR